MPNDQQLDVVQHPILGPLKFPKDMPFEERNASIQRQVTLRSSQPGAMQTSKGGPIVNANQQNAQSSPRSIANPGEYSQFQSMVEGGKTFGGGITNTIESIPKFSEAGNKESVLGSWPEQQVGDAQDYRARAQQALASGDPVAFIGHMLNSILAPTMIPQSVEGLSQTAQQDPLRAAGQLTGMALLEKAPDIMPSKVGLQRTLTIGPKLTEEALTKRSTQIGEDVAKYGQQTRDWQSAVKGKIEQGRISGPQAFDDAETKYQQRVQTVQQANAESQAGFNQRQQHLDIADQHAKTISERLPQVYDAAKKEASAAYGPQPKGTFEPEELKTAIKDAASAKLQGNTTLPTAVSKIIADIDKPPEPTLLDQASVFKGAGKQMRAAGTLDDLSPKARAKFYEQNPEAERQQGTSESTGKTLPLDAQRIHGFMSELGRASRIGNISKDEIGAINATRSMLEQRLGKLYRDEGRVEDFAKGQAAWKQMVNTFENTSTKNGSPVARALQMKEGPDGPLRPDYVQAVLSEKKAFNVAKEHLGRYAHLGAPINELEVMKTNGDFADTLPSSVKWKGAPGGPNYPKVTEWGNMPQMPDEPTAPPEIDPQQLKSERLKQIANGLQTMTSRWGAMGDIAGIAAAPFTGGKSLMFPARHPVGWALENPKVVNWLTKPSLEELNKIAPSKVALKRAMENAKP